MESDSLIENGAVVDSSAPEQVLPSPEQLGISVSSGPVPELTVGDTFDYQVTVSWSVQGSSLLVVPVSSATAKGLTQLGMSQESARSVKDGAEIASITFTYKLMAQDTGNLNIPALRFEIPTALGSSIDLRSESVPVRVAKSAAERSLRERMDVLKQRVNVADSREWLLELEGACKEYAQEKLGLAAADVNLESLVKDGKLEGWETLVEEFAHARYGGGQRDGFQNLETWKAAIRLMGIKEE